MNKIFKYLVIYFLVINNAFSTLDVLITQGMNNAIPIKINSCDVNEISNVIINDINRSGLLRSAKNEENTDYYTECSVTKKNSNFKVNFKLKNSDEIGKELLNREFDVNTSQFRNLSHKISDLIFEKLTDIKGVFSLKIAYINVIWEREKISKYILEIADIDGYNPKPVVISDAPIMSPSFSPDGKTIAYVSFEGGKSSIKTFNLESGQVQLIADFKGINGAPSWSHDGKKMALVLSYEKIPNIYVLDLSSKVLTQITDGWSLDTEPAWSFDDKSILFTSNRGGTVQIYRYYFNNKEVHRVTFEGGYNAHGSFVPQSNKIIFMHKDNLGRFRIASLNLDNDNLEILTNNFYAESPSVSPNGYHIIYATHGEKYGILGEVTVDGKAKWILPARNGDVQEPTWSPLIS